MVVAVDVTERLQQQQVWEALHEIATAVARNAAPADISERVAAIVRELFNVDSAAVVRFTGASSAEIVAMAPTLPATLSRRHIFAPTDESATVRVAVTGKPALVVYGQHGGPAAQQMRACGFQSAAAAPVRVRGGLWGVVTLTSKSRTGVTEAMMERLAQFAELVEIAIGNTEARTDLELQATTDALSGLPNRRALEQHLEEQVALAGSRGTNLSAVVLDIDHFKRINDTYGHLTGDVVLAEVAARLRAAARAGRSWPASAVKNSSGCSRKPMAPRRCRRPNGPGRPSPRTVRGCRLPDHLRRGLRVARRHGRVPPGLRGPGPLRGQERRAQPHVALRPPHAGGPARRSSTPGQHADSRGA